MILLVGLKFGSHYAAKHSMRRRNPYDIGQRYGVTPENHLETCHTIWNNEDGIRVHEIAEVTTVDAGRVSDTCRLLINTGLAVGTQVPVTQFPQARSVLMTPDPYMGTYLDEVNAELTDFLATIDGNTASETADRAATVYAAYEGLDITGIDDLTQHALDLPVKPETAVYRGILGILGMHDPRIRDLHALKDLAMREVSDIEPEA